jgi:HK97 family phage major capsid protein
MDPELKAIGDKHAATVSQLRDLGARTASWTASDRAKFKRLRTEEKALGAQLDAKRQTNDTQSRIDKAVSDKFGNRVNGQRLDANGREIGRFEEDDEITVNFSNSKGERRASYSNRKKKTISHLRTAGYKPAGRGGEFKTFADFVRSGLDSHTTSVFKDRVKKHFGNAVEGMSEGVGSDGGFMVMPEFGTGIIDRVYSNDLWSRTDNYTVSGNNMTFLANAETSRAAGSRHGGMRGYWLGEGGTITDSKPTLRELTLKLCKLGVVVYLTQELLDDGGSALEEYVTRKAAEEFEFMIGDALVNGTGVGQPLGILTAPSLVSVAKESGQLADTLETENIVKMYSRFYQANIGNSTWLHNQDIGPELYTMTLGVGTGGVVTYMPPGALADSPHANLMGRPMLPTEFNATLGDQGDLILADLGQMLSISKGSVAQAVSMHVQFLTDQLALRFILRLNAGPWESAPITPYKGTANTQSNFITLDARA